VGFVAWGATQGVVRDTVALCRSFGLKVVGLYPKQIVPFRDEEIESFAETVGRVVLVESGQTPGYWDRLRAGFSFEAAMMTPQPGKALTPMDIFLREGLGSI
jgi:pyruvate/2-oxoacid:ferredoxin oxidoreductase alpha subunit